jgi:YD repeat-containing protein
MNTIYKAITLLISLTYTTTCFAQLGGNSEPKIETDVPKIAPPSPTVAALMKFEEIPVSNYTGVPDISIPLYSVQSRSKDITVDLKLSYHPASIAAKEEASYTGLGWNLIAGGTISRTVRGFPDELLEESRIGIFRNSGANQSNKYYEMLSLIGTNLSQANVEMINRFLYDTYEKGKYDTEEDLYQYNFMGQTGRFVLRKDNLGQLKVVKLSNDNALKIDVYYDSNFAATHFIIYDDKGYKYTFDVKEITTENNTTVTTTHHPENNGTFNMTAQYIYTSAFHLSKIEDPHITDVNYQSIVSFIYNYAPEYKMDHIAKNSMPLNGAINYDLFICQDWLNHLEPKAFTSSTNRSIATKKLQTINVEGKARISFMLEGGRQDSTPLEALSGLSGITIKDWNNVILKSFELHHGYSTVNSKKRMILEKVIERAGTLTQTYSLEYNNVSGLGLENLDIDYWGYFTERPFWHVGFYREANPRICTTDVLKKMTLPTGGCIIFNFESNTYSYIGDTALNNFDENPNNWIYDQDTTLDFTSVPGNNIKPIPTASATRYVRFFPTVYSLGYDGNPNFQLNPGAFNFICPAIDPDCASSERILAPNVNYTITFGWFNRSADVSAKVVMTSKRKRSPILEYLYGGGVRIKSISYYDVDVDKNYVPPLHPNAANQIMPAKQKNYNYSFFGTNRSSGSLAFPKPVFEYNLYNREVYADCRTENGLPFGGGLASFDFKVFTDFNNLLAIKTQGADVGYKNVTVTETGNGRTEYTYTSPIDHPEESYTISYPFMPSKNFDYKRGLLKLEEIFRNDGKRLVRTEYDYTIEEGMEVTGLRLAAPQNCPYPFMYPSGESYMTMYNGCLAYANTIECNLGWHCDQPNTWIIHPKIYEAFGWAQLDTVMKTEYFYDNNGIANGTLVTQDTFTFNSFNKRLATHATDTYRDGTNVESISKYYYYNNRPNNNISSIDRIETRRGMELLSTQKILYKNTFTGTTAYLPEYVQAAKGSQSPENRVKFIDYDMFGNVLEVKLENGTSVCYVWGYNSTAPIAMIENIKYSDLPSGLVDAAKAASNGTSESGLLLALNALRNDPVINAPEVFITTYTYKPLVGVTTITDPKGYRTTFSYDDFGRLKEVRDADNNLLSENEYRHRIP